jgi:hypothetical protein
MTIYQEENNIILELAIMLTLIGLLFVQCVEIQKNIATRRGGRRHKIKV